ncbi:MAG: DUF4783 domain-containing protein [Bacteroidota bacterium]|nr:DUF4783 domain-containing protein [Bacteroidota bacterium]
MMKKIPIYALLFTLLSSFWVNPEEEIIKALKSGEAAGVAQYFDNTVQISLPDKSGSYSKKQATLVLRDFFSATQIKDFQVLHQSENTESEYLIGNLVTQGGPYRTTIFIRKIAGKELIQELRFEK